MNLKYFKAPAGWTPDSKNPFSQDGNYGKQWSCCIVGHGEKYRHICGSGKNALFKFGVTFDDAGLQHRLADYLRYENQYKRNAILSFPDDMDSDGFVKKALSETSNPDTVRESDPKWVVHSTNLKAWEDIQRDGALKALAVLLREGKNVAGVGFNQLNEPPEYAEYIMFGKIDTLSPEYVVASQRQGRIVTEADAPYEPGVRLYFDNHKIIKSGLGARDGLHLIKVHRCLPLVSFLAAAISVADSDSMTARGTWTPNTFLEAANNEFLKRMLLRADGAYDR